jgi:hypothetical protein
VKAYPGADFSTEAMRWREVNALETDEAGVVEEVDFVME